MSELNKWLKALCRDTSSSTVWFKRSPLGGLGGFAKKDIPAGTVLFDIPRHLVLSSACRSVQTHPLVHDLARDFDVTAETLLFVYMILGHSKSKERNEMEGYLSSLPAHPTLLIAEEMQGTNVGSQVTLDYIEVLAQLERIHLVKGLAFITLQDLMVAKFNYNSRRYPFHLAPTDMVLLPEKQESESIHAAAVTLVAAAEGAAGSTRATKKRRLSDGINSKQQQQQQPQRRVYDASQGALVPLLDILNHAAPPIGAKRVLFDISIPTIVRVTTGVAYSKDEEIYSDYGCVNNDQSLLQFGYFDKQCRDVYTVVLGGRRYDLHNGVKFPEELVADGGHGLLKHLSGKLAVVLQAKPSSNQHVVAYMSKQQALLRALIAQCEAYAEEEEEEEEAREGEEDSD